MDAAKANFDALINRLFDFLQKFVWELGFRHVSNFCKLEKNLQALKHVIEDLKADKKDLLNRILVEEQSPGKKRLERVKLWIKRVEEYSITGKNLLKEGDIHLGRLCLGGIWSDTCLATTGFGRKVAACLKILRKLKEEDLAVVVADAAPQQQQQGYGQQQDGTAHRKLSRRRSFDYSLLDQHKVSIRFRDDNDVYGHSFPGSDQAYHYQNLKLPVKQEGEPENDLMDTENAAPEAQLLYTPPPPVSQMFSVDNLGALLAIQGPKFVVLIPTPPPLPKFGTKETITLLPPSTPPNGERPLKSLDEKQLDRENQDGPRGSLTKKQQEKQDLLIKCLSEDLGFSNGRPVTACHLYKYLLQLGLFEVDETTLFQLIIKEIDSVIKAQDDFHILSYWLSNTSMLSLLIHRTIKPGRVARSNSQKRRSISASLSGGNSPVLYGSQGSAGFPFLEATYHVMAFKEQLENLLRKIYRTIRQNLRTDIYPVLGLCIQAPGTLHPSSVKVRSPGNALTLQQVFAPWESIVAALNDCLNRMRENYVPTFLVRKLFAQTFLFINMHLFKRLLLLREGFSFSSCEYVKAGLDMLKQWCDEATAEFAGSAWDELKHIKQAIQFLLILRIGGMTLQRIREEHCPDLSIQQLHKISTISWDDRYGTSNVSTEVTSSLKIMIEDQDSNHEHDSSFLLKDDDSIPFKMEELYKSMKQVEVSDINPAPLISELY